MVLPGLPGWSQSADDRVQNPYPDTTLNMVEILRSNGHTVEHAFERSKRQEISLNAAECWVPVLVFANDVGVETCVQCSAAIRHFVGRRAIADETAVRRPPGLDGTVEYFEGHGDGDKVLEAIRCFGDGESR